MSQTLYRKYRPKDFASIVDQNHIKITLQKAVASGKISHAYLFTGPRGVGKTTTARILAKAINCTAVKDGEPCNQCDICTSINQGKLLDLVELDAASRRKIDEIKEFKEHIKYPPNLAKYKVFIIDEVHMLTEVSFNALLKTLEEPPEYSIFILCTTAIHKIPETIISRCQRFDFKRVSLKDIVANLEKIADEEKIKVDEKILKTIARLAEGSLRDAQSLMNQIIALGDKEISWQEAAMFLPRSDIDLTTKLWQHLANNEPMEGIKLVGKLIDEGVDIFYFADEFLDLMRKLLLLKIDKKLDSLSEILSQEQFKELSLKLESLNVEFLKKSLDIMLYRRQQLTINQIIQLPLEMAIIEITSLHQSGTQDTQDKPDFKPPSPKTKDNPKKTNHSASQSGAVLTKVDNKTVEKIVDEVSQVNYPLAGILKTSSIQSEGDNLIIGVAHSFHKEQVEKTKNLNLISSVLKKLQSGKFTIKVIVTTTNISQPEPDNQFPETNVDDIIKILGGKVVEGGVVEE